MFAAILPRAMIGSPSSFMSSSRNSSGSDAAISFGIIVGVGVVDWRKPVALVDDCFGSDAFGSDAFGTDCLGSDAFSNEGFGSEGQVDGGFGSDRFGISGPRGSTQRLVPMLHAISEAGFCKHTKFFCRFDRNEFPLNS